jgi:hypothetical protein
MPNPRDARSPAELLVSLVAFFKANASYPATETYPGAPIKGEWVPVYRKLAIQTPNGEKVYTLAAAFEAIAAAKGWTAQKGSFKAVVAAGKAAGAVRFETFWNGKTRRFPNESIALPSTTKGETKATVDVADFGFASPTTSNDDTIGF